MRPIGQGQPADHLFSKITCFSYTSATYDLFTFTMALNTMQNQHYQHLCLSTIKSINFVDNKLNIAKMIISDVESIENTMGKAENPGKQHALFFPQ